MQVQSNPEKYGAPKGLDPPSLDRWIKTKMVLRTVKQLTHSGLAQTDDDCFSLTALRPGVIMSEHCIRLQTMCAITGCAQRAGIPELLTVIAR